MEIIFVLLPLSIALGAIFLAAFWWSANNGQYEDLQTPAVRVLPDDEFGNDRVGGNSGK